MKELAASPPIRSSRSNVAWPAVPPPEAASVLAALDQFDDTERLPAADLERMQLGALARVFRHARRTVPYYRDAPGYDALDGSGPLTHEDWRRLPVLTRAEVQDADRALVSESVPKTHQPLNTLTTTGSTGRPIKAVGTKVTSHFWIAVTARYHLWHGIDVTGKLAAIRAERSDYLPAEGLRVSGWGPGVDTIYRSGPSCLLSIQNDVSVQARWLASENPDYLLSYPSNLAALASHFQDSGEKLPALRGVQSYGEMLSPAVRVACWEAWGVEVRDMYSSQEVGYMALQCPTGEHYHVQSEVVRLEVLDEQDEPCPPGGVGRVVVSILHNWAMPLFRYEVGDYAEVGGECTCGRRLPVLRRIMGRQRNMLALPNGQKTWPTFPHKAWAHLDAIRQLQLVQHQVDHIEARTVGPRPLTAEEEGEFARMLQERFKFPFRVTFSYRQQIDRAESRKFEDFVSHVA